MGRPLPRLFVVRKLIREKPNLSDPLLLSLYYLLDTSGSPHGSALSSYTVFQSPDLKDLINSRLAKCAYHMRNAFARVADCAYLKGGRVDIDKVR
jgi:hypothetical protein